MAGDAVGADVSVASVGGKVLGAGLGADVGVAVGTEDAGAPVGTADGALLGDGVAGRSGGAVVGERDVGAAVGTDDAGAPVGIADDGAGVAGETVGRVVIRSQVWPAVLQSGTHWWVRAQLQRWLVTLLTCSQMPCSVVSQPWLPSLQECREGASVGADVGRDAGASVGPIDGDLVQPAHEDAQATERTTLVTQRSG